jgi:hypothetical protein
LFCPASRRRCARPARDTEARRLRLVAISSWARASALCEIALGDRYEEAFAVPQTGMGQDKFNYFQKFGNSEPWPEDDPNSWYFYART